MFDQIVILDRWASHRHNPTTMQWNKMNGGELTPPPPFPSVVDLTDSYGRFFLALLDVFREIKAPSDWWAPVRESMMMTLGLENIHDKPRPTVVYISR